MELPLLALTLRVYVELGLPESVIELTVWPEPTVTYTTIRSPEVNIIEAVVARLELTPVTGTAATNAMAGALGTVTDMLTECTKLPEVPVTVTV